MGTENIAPKKLAAAITYKASRQTYITLRLLADRERVSYALEAYAYFRWVDDCLDDVIESRAERLRFLIRQQSLLEVLSSGNEFGRLKAEEEMLADLIASDPSPDSGLRSYLEHMMAVMAFDAQRRDRLVTQEELDSYTHHLAVAVTEHLHYFIGHGSSSPRDETRYAAATAAHIAHMLRDTQSDIEMGYFNMPIEVLGEAGIRPQDVEHPAYRAWVRERVELARKQLSLAHDYLSRVKCWRVRLAGHSYLSRFVSILNLIERDQFVLRLNYPKRRTFSGVMTFLGSLHASLFTEAQRSVPIQVTRYRHNR